MTTRRDILIGGLATVCAPSLAISSPTKSMLGAQWNSFVSIAEELPIPSVTNYVQDGLTNMWDGIENVGLGIHNANPSAWHDLVGNVNLIKESNVAYQWKKDHVQFKTSSGGQGYYSNTRINPGYAEIVFRMVGIPDTTTINGLFSTTKTSNTTRKQGQVFVRNGTLIVGILSGYTYDITESYNDLHSVSFGTNDTTRPPYFPWYVDGNAIISATGTYYNNGSNDYIHVGSFWAGSNSCIYSVRLYNRVLTAEEISYNHGIDKARFK